MSLYFNACGTSDKKFENCIELKSVVICEQNLNERRPYEPITVN